MPAEQDNTSLLLEDLKHFGESLWRNDEIGEKRFSFYVTLVTAVIAGLVTLHTSEGVTVDKLLITRGAVGGLLLLGLMTFMRLLQRNRVTSEYHKTLDYIREQLIKLGAAPAGYKVPRQMPRSPAMFRGGLAESTGLLCGILLSVLVVLWCEAYVAAALAGLLLFALCVTLAHRP